MPESNLTSFILLPKLKLSDFSYDRSSKIVTFECSTKSEWDICPFCTMKTSTVHDRRWVNIKDAPHGQKQKMLKVLKKRFRCQKYGCKKVFTETIPDLHF
ncbi:MAG: transposase family protein [Bacteriovoracaceae bacterium]